MSVRKQRVSEAQTAAFALCASFVWTWANAAPPTLPVPCGAAACGANGPAKWNTIGAATWSATSNSLQINQSTNSAILNWASFNIGAGNSVTFQQPTSSSIALNRIFQDSPTQIFGQLNANGQVYLINLNGFIFGPKSTVNVGSLLVSSLPLALQDADFAKGILSPASNNQAVLDTTLDPVVPGGRTVVVDSLGNKVLDSQENAIPVQVAVQPGAQITAGDQGRVLLAGQRVTNGGTLTAPDGQVVLAAGAKVYLQASSDPNVRGLVVEVDQNGAGNTGGNGTAWNQLTGAISAPHGNVTMVGLAVNQEGRISATTSTSANGSIRLLADNAYNVSTNNVDETGGKITVGAQSDMEILPDLSAADTGVKTDLQPQSAVSLLGEQIFIKGGKIVAPDGNLTAVASNLRQFTLNAVDSGATPQRDASGQLDTNARLRVDSGTSVDLSGSNSTLPAAANLVAVQLRSAELADDPTQRDGPLHGLTVYVDRRNLPSASLANVQGDVDAVPETVAQRTVAGGHAVLQSAGDLVFSNGASINVSGGTTTYSGGVLQTSYLLGADGRLYPISTANPLLSYVGVVNPNFSQTYNKWGVKDVLPTPGLSSYQPGYVDGGAAGSVQFAAPAMVLQGTLQGSAVNGIYQRTPATAVPGGTLIIGVPGGIATANPLAIDYLSPTLQFTRNPAPIGTSDDTSLPQPLPLYFPTSYLTDSGFTATKIYSNYDVTLPAGPSLTLPSGSTLAVNAARVNVLSGITDPGGSLSFQSVDTVGSTTIARPGVLVGDGVSLDVSGRWTNDLPMIGGTGLAQTWQNGGTIDLGVATIGGLLSIGNGVSLQANGGAWLTAKGSLTGGTGGTVNLHADELQTGLDIGSGLAISGFGVQGAKGGTFDLAAPRIEISGGSGAWADAQQVDDTLAPGSFFKVRPSLFSDYGFQNFTLDATGLVAQGAANTTLLSVDPGTAINATVSSLYVPSKAFLTSSATSLDGIATATLLPAFNRPAASVALDALPRTVNNPSVSIGQTPLGDVLVGTGASITTDPDGSSFGSISLTGLRSLIVDGLLRAPGGKVTLQILSPQASGSPYQSLDAGFLADQRIEVGPAAQIDVSGTFVPKPSTSLVPLDLGTIYGGGAVNLYADRGAVVAERGSSISIAGASAPRDVLQWNGIFAHEIAASAAGSITAHSGESIFLLGGIDAAAGVGSSGAAAAGSLEVDLTQSESWWTISSYLSSFNQTPMTVNLVPQQPVVAGLPTLLFSSNQATLGADQLSQSGLDALRIEAGGSVLVSGNFSLALHRSIAIDAPVISATSGANGQLAAPYMEVGYTPAQSASVNSNTATPGTGRLRFSGSEVDLVGTTVFQNVADVGFSSSGDLVLRGSSNGSVLSGELDVAGNLTLDAARIFPVSTTSFKLAASEPAVGLDGTITIGQTTTSAGTPYSGGGTLNFQADDIATKGTVYAPFGQINLQAAKTLELGDGSVTSVSGGGLTIPYGQTTFGGTNWVYNNGLSDPILAGVPTRAINLNAPKVGITGGATIDLSGGGDLLAYEFVPGSGGTRDQLAPNGRSFTGNIPGLYAVIPSTRGQAAPQDPLYAGVENIGAGESVYLSGGAGLAAGVYPLLPARYALVPGAYLIQAEPKTLSSTAGSLGTLADGTPVVAGYLSYGATGLHQTPGYTGFAIHPGSYGGKLAEYTLSLASGFFSQAAALAGTARPPLPADAGSLSINVGSGLDAAAGSVIRTAAAPGGVAASIEISANDLVLGNVSGPVPADAVTIQGAVLAGWHPGSLLLGGSTQSNTSTETDIHVLANSVTIGSGANLTADQIVIVANQSVDVQNGAVLQTTSSAGGTAPATAPPAKSLGLVATDGTPAGAGLLALSDLNWLIPTAASSGGSATIAVDAGASVGSKGSLSLSGPAGSSLNGNLTGPGAKWLLAASSIAFVPDAIPETPAAGSVPDALSIGTNLLSQLGTASAVRLASTGSIDVMTPITLGVDGNGKPSLQSLTLSASSLQNPKGSTATFGARALVLEGFDSNASTATAGPAGVTLSLFADELDVGPNTLSVSGFGATRATVSGAVIGKGSGTLNVGGDLLISTPGVTVASGADTRISAGGALNIAPANGDSPKIPVTLGGALRLSGDSVDIAGSVSAPSGIIKVSSTAGAVTLESGAMLSTAGQVVTIGNQSVGTPGGGIAIDAAGDLTLATGATLDASGAAATNGVGAGGTQALEAAGAATVAATLNGSGGTGAAGGSFSLDAGSLARVGSGGNPLTTLAASINSGGFNTVVDIRTRSGNLSLDSGSTLAANSVGLTADTGSITLGGAISASSDSLRGRISVFGGNGVELLSGAALRADGTGSSGLGGTIEIGAGRLVAGTSGNLDTYNSGSIQLDQGSRISATGDAGKGTLLLRAPALQATNEVAIGSIDSDTSGLGAITVEPVLPFNTATATDLTQVQTAVGTYMAGANPQITGRFSSLPTPLLVEAGVEIISQGAWTLNPLDLSTWHTPNGTATGAPVDLTVRSAADLTVTGTISDGFGGSSNQPTLLPGPSSSIRLIAGADLSSANPLCTVAGTGNLTIGAGSNTVVRTGTGDVDLVAGGNIVLGGAGSGAYTAGTAAIAPGGNESNPYPNIPTTLGTPDPSGAGVVVTGTNLLMSFPHNGGNLTVRAGVDIDGAALQAPGVSNWQLREGGSASLGSLPMWGVNLANYDWNFGTLGGGDVRISAGHDALNVTAAAADSLLPQYGGAAQYVKSGGVSFTAGNDIGSAEVFLADGRGTVTAAGALTAIRPDTSSNAATPQLVGSAFFLQSSSLDVTARTGVAVDGIYNPTTLGQLPAGKKALVGGYITYSPDSELSLRSMAGDIILGQDGNATPVLLGINLANQTGSQFKGVLPGTLTVNSFSGNISFGAGIGSNGTLILSPSPTGQLDLLAAQDITASPGGGKVQMSDAVPGSYASLASPFSSTSVGDIAELFKGNLHVADSNPVLVTAGGTIEDLNLSFPKAGQVVAGRDITNLTYSGENLSATDFTLLKAGRDLTYSLNSGDTNAVGNGISVGGPGNLEILAGRNVSLGFSEGVATTGNLINADLPTSQGANVTIMTGLNTAEDFAGFVSSIIVPSPTYQAELVSYVEKLQGASGLSFTAAESAFGSLTPQQQQPLIDSVFFNELLVSGRAQNSTPGAGFKEGYAAVDALFPGSRSATSGAVNGSYAGDLTLAFSKIYTLGGGDINLLVPGGTSPESPSGLLNVGLANPPPSAPSKDPSRLGIVAEGPGNINIYTKSDVNVNASRIFTLGGGNILIWSDEGNIDAGKGAKSAISAPPPTILVAQDGTITQDFSGAVAGSGIRTIQTNPSQPLGSVDLIAPVGIIDAGDAGIGAAGNINLASRAVVGLDNISFGGTSAGVPAEVSNLGASLSGASAAGSGATTNASAAAEEAQKKAEQNGAAPLTQAALSWLDVFVTGLGEENCHTDDLDCLKRQKSNLTN